MMLNLVDYDSDSDDPFNSSPAADPPELPELHADPPEAPSREKELSTSSLVKLLGIDLSDLRKGRKSGLPSFISKQPRSTASFLPRKRSRSEFLDTRPEVLLDSIEDETTATVPTKRRRATAPTAAPEIPNALLSLKSRASLIPSSAETRAGLTLPDSLDSDVSDSVKRYLELDEESKKAFDADYAARRPADFLHFRQLVEDHKLGLRMLEKGKGTQGRTARQRERETIVAPGIVKSSSTSKMRLANGQEVNVVDVTGGDQDEMIERLRKTARNERFRREVFNPRRYKVLQQGSVAADLARGDQQLLRMARDAARNEMEYDSIRFNGMQSQKASWRRYGW